MQSVSNSNFGPLIAFLVPGLTALLGASQISPTLQSWIAMGSVNPPTIGGFLYLTVASITVGMVVSAIRWAVVDSVHAWTGLRMPPLDFHRLKDSVEAIQLLIEIHYRHYQFYANMFIATIVAYVCYRRNLPELISVGWIDVGVGCLLVIFAAASRDTLRKYYRRSEQVLGSAPHLRPKKIDSTVAWRQFNPSVVSPASPRNRKE